MLINGNITLTQGAEIRNATVERYSGGDGGVTLPPGVAGRIIFNTDENLFYIYNGTEWTVISEGPNAGLQHIYDSTLHGGPSTTHIVTHNINQRFVTTSVYSNPGIGSPPVPDQIIPLGVFLDSATQLTVTFDMPVNCYVVVTGVPNIVPT